MSKLECGHDTPGLAAGMNVGCRTCGHVTNFERRICTKCMGKGYVVFIHTSRLGETSPRREVCWCCNGEGKIKT